MNLYNPEHIMMCASLMAFSLVLGFILAQAIMALGYQTEYAALFPLRNEFTSTPVKRRNRCPTSWLKITRKGGIVRQYNGPRTVYLSEAPNFGRLEKVAKRGSKERSRAVARASGRRWIASEEEYGARHEVPKSALRQVRSVDFGRIANVQVLQGAGTVRVFGRSTYDGELFAFPVRTTNRKMEMFLHELSKRPVEVRKALINNGVIHESIRELYAKVYDAPPPQREEVRLLSNSLTTKVEIIATTAQLVLAIYRRDIANVTLTLLSHVSWSTNLSDLLNTSNELLPQFLIDHSLVEESEDEPSVDEDGNCFLANKSRFLNLGLPFIPKFVDHSGPTRGIVALTSFLMLAHFTNESSYFGPFLKKVNFKKITEPVVGALLIAQCVKALWQGFVDFSESGDWKDFFSPPKDVVFFRMVEPLIHSEKKTMSVDELKAQLKLISEIQKSREYLMNSPTVERYLVLLRERTKYLLTMLESCGGRMEPIPIWINGDPGFGKTTLIDGTLNVLAKRDGFARALGDVIDYNVYDKFPVESGSLCDAKFIVMNDIKEDYSQDLKLGITPVDTMLQKIIDINKLELPQAFEKGKCFYDLRYIVIISNFTSFKMSNKTEKLQRRLEPGVLMQVRLEDEKGQHITYSDENLSQGQMNSQRRFYLNKVICKDYHVSFALAQGSFSAAKGHDYHWYYEYLLKRTAEKRAKQMIAHQKFFSAQQTCECGAPFAHHYVLEGWKPIMNSCRPPEGVVEEVKEQSAPRRTHTKVWNIGSPESVEEDVFEEPSQIECPLLQEGEFRAGVWKKLTSRFRKRRTNQVQPAHEPANVVVNSWFDFDMFATLPDFLVFAVCLPGFLLVDVCESYMPNWDTLSQVATLPFRAAGRFASKAANAEFLWYRKAQFVAACNGVSPRLTALVLPGWRIASAEAYVKFREFGERVVKFVKENKAAVGALLAGGLLLALLANYWGSESLQGPILSRSTVNEASITTFVKEKPQIFPVAPVNSWQRPNDVPVWKMVTQTAGVDILKTFEASLAVCEISNNSGSLLCQAVIFSPNLILINHHYISEALNGPFLVCIDGITAQFTADDIQVLKGSEMVGLRNVWRKVTPNLSKYLCHESPSGSHDGILLRKERTPEGGYGAVVRTPCVASKSNIKVRGRSFESYEVKMKASSGDCGSLMAVRVKNSYAIMGVLFADSTTLSGTRVHFTPLTVSMFEGVALMPQIDEFIVDRVPSPLEPVSDKSAALNRPSPFFGLLGSIGVSRSFKSAIHKTALHDDVVPRMKLSYDRPKHLSKMIDGVYHSAFTNTFKNYDLSDLSTSSLRRVATDAYLDDCLKPLQKKEVKIAPLSLAQAFFGEPALGVEKVPFKTSNGLYWREQGLRKKADLFDETEEEWLLTPKFKDQVDQQLECLRQGIVRAPLVEMVPKDEVKSDEALAKAKIRLFSVLDFDINIVFRMYMMPLLAYLLQNKEFSECYGQMNAASKQWDELYRRLLSVGNHFVDLDFSSYDSSHGARTFEMTAEFFYALALRLGYDEPDAKAVFYLMMSLSVQLATYQGDYFLKKKGMPSGVIVTLILNSVVNSIMMRMAFHELVPDIDVKKFSDYVKVATVGDDNLSSVSPDVIDRFNMVKAAPLYKAWGYVVTPAKKDTEFLTSIRPTEATFVKRTFVEWTDGYVRAPLDTDSLYKALAFETLAPGVTSASRLASVYGSVVREAYLHGRVFFDEFVEWINNLFDKYGYYYEPLNFEVLNAEFLEGGMTTDFA